MKQYKMIDLFKFIYSRLKKMNYGIMSKIPNHTSDNGSECDNHVAI